MTARSFARRRVTSIELTDGKEFGPTGPALVPPPRAAHVIIRLHGHPIGATEVVADASTNLVEAARKFAWEHLREEINYHLERDGLAPPKNIDDLAKIKAECAESLSKVDGEAPFISVAIPTVGNQDACIRTVKRVLESKYPTFEVIVIDNTPGPSNLGEVLATSITDKRVRYAHEIRKGASFARNRGIDDAKGEIIAFADDDVITDPTWLFAIARIFSVDPAVGCVTGAILAAEIETPAQAWLEQYGGYNKGFHIEVYDLKENRRHHALYPYDAGRFGSGANMAVRASVLRDIGGFAPELGAGTPAHGGEDIDLLLRVVTGKHRLVYEPAALLWHYHRRSYPALRLQMFRYGAGLSATVTKWMLEDPRTAFAILRRLPSGMQHIFSPNSKKNKYKTTYYPGQLTWLERAGLAAGPFLYLKSRAVVRGRK